MKWAIFSLSSGWSGQKSTKSGVFWRSHFIFTEEDSLKAIASYFENFDDSNEDEDASMELEELEDEEGGMDMIQMAIDDDPKDLDWIPPSLQKHVQD
jgi:hypothetical protein